MGSRTGIKSSKAGLAIFFIISCKYEPFLYSAEYQHNFYLLKEFIIYSENDFFGNNDLRLKRIKHFYSLHLRHTAERQRNYLAEGEEGGGEGGEEEAAQPEEGAEGTICPGSSDPFYIVSYYIKWVTSSWTHSINKISDPDPHFFLVKIRILQAGRIMSYCMSKK